MRGYLVAFAAVIICLLPIAAHAQQEPSDTEIKAAIARLGEGTDENGFRILLIRKPVIWCGEGDLNPHGVTR